LELLALVLFNIVFGIILYFILSIKITSSVRDYQIVKLKKEIQTHTLNFFKESENYLALMDSRITIFKNLIERAESLGVDFQREVLLPEPKFSSPGIIKKEDNPVQMNSSELLQKFTEERDRILHSPPTPSPKFPKQQPEIIPEKEIDQNGILPSLGRLFRSILGIPDPVDRIEEMETNTIQKKISTPPSRGIDFSVGGNPLLENNYLSDNNKSPSEFEEILSGNINKKSPVKKDKIEISPRVALKEISETAPKVDKVVHLLKKGFSHSEISEELGLAIPEISLIETIKMERNRRI